MLLEISLSRNCTRQSEVSYDVSKVLMEGDDEACLHRVKLAGMLKSLAENTEKNYSIWEKRCWLRIIYIIFTLSSLTSDGQLTCKDEQWRQLSRKPWFHSTWLFNLLFAQRSGWELKLTLFRVVLTATLLAAVEGGWTHPGAMSFQVLCDDGGEEQRVWDVLILGIPCAV